MIVLVAETTSFLNFYFANCYQTAAAAATTDVHGARACTRAIFSLFPPIDPYKPPTTSNQQLTTKLRSAHTVVNNVISV